MERKKVLEARKRRLQGRVKKLMERSEASEDINEVRSIHEKLEEIKEDLQDVEEELAALKEDEKEEETSEPGQEETGQEQNAQEGRSGAPLSGDMEIRGGNIVSSYRQNEQAFSSEKNIDPSDTKEYRTAFMEYVCRGTKIPDNLAATVKREDTNAVTTTGDAGAVIPNTIMQEIIREMDTYGNVYAAVRKLNIQGGVSIPILSLKPEAKWIGETESSKSQKLEANDKITFSYFGVECKIAQTLLANVVTLDAFQQLFVPLATEAIVKALEISVFHGDGKVQPLGILNDTRIPKANTITISQEEMTWGGWHEKVKKKMKKAYRNGTFFMNQATFDDKIDGMEDKNGQPVGRTNYGINGEETYRFMGKSVETVEDGCLPDFEDAAEGDVFAIFMNPKNYIINSNMQMRTVKWTDNDNNEIKNKCILICDGKLADANGVLIIKKGKGGTSAPGSGELSES